MTTAIALPSTASRQIMAFRSANRRFGLGVLPAVLITTALYFGMNWLIKVDDFEPPVLPHHDLIDITPSQIDEPVRRSVRPKPNKIDVPVPPPVQPLVVPAAANTTLPSFAPAGAGDMTLPTDLSGMKLATPIISNRFAQALYPPQPVYPVRAITAHLEGDCEVVLNITAQGVPYDVVATCTNNVFERNAQRAVERVRFQPGIENGRQVGLRGLVYPMEFRMGEE